MSDTLPSTPAITPAAKPLTPAITPAAVAKPAITPAAVAKPLTPAVPSPAPATTHSMSPAPEPRGTPSEVGTVTALRNDAESKRVSAAASAHQTNDIHLEGDQVLDIKENGAVAVRTLNKDKSATVGDKQSMHKRRIQLTLPSINRGIKKREYTIKVGDNGPAVFCLATDRSWMDILVEQDKTISIEMRNIGHTDEKETPVTLDITETGTSNRTASPIGYENLGLVLA